MKHGDTYIACFETVDMQLCVYGETKTIVRNQIKSDLKAMARDGNIDAARVASTMKTIAVCKVQSDTKLENSHE